MKQELSNIKDAIADFRSGKMLIVVDDAKRENEGDLVIAGEKVTPEAINFMAKYGRGLICVPMLKKRLDTLCIGLMEENQEELFNCKFTVSVDARTGTTTGISAADRANTIKALIDPASKPSDFRRPGHVFPLIANDGGIRIRPGHTEATIELTKLAGLYPAGVICEIIRDDGQMARLPELLKFGKEHGLKVVSIEDIHDFINKENRVQLVSESKLPSQKGFFKILVFEDKANGDMPVVLVKGNVKGKSNVLVRVHSECLTGDTFLSQRCDCGPQLHLAMERIEKEGAGIIIYLRQEGRGIGIANKIKAYALQDKGYDTVEANLKLGFFADLRDYGIAAKVIKNLGIKSIRLMTNNPKKISGLAEHGIKISKRVEDITGKTKYNMSYLKTKKNKLGHML